MRRVLFGVFFVTAPALSHEITCPKFYPWEDTKLAEVPYQHKGFGVVSKSRISAAGVFAGELPEPSEQQGERRKVKGGYDVHFGFGQGERKWLLCSYGRSGDIKWWEELSPRISRCTLQVRETGAEPKDVRLSCE